MSKKWIIGYFILLFLPFLLLLLFSGPLLREKPPQTTPEEETVTLYRHQSKTTEILPLEDYLWGVVAGEMPASYHQEALKAQAVASYTYLLYRKNNMAAHPNSDFGHAGDICDDPAHCKAYLSPAEATAKWGEAWHSASFQRIADAVEAVKGQVVLYEGAPANTVFHAISGGKTEDAADVWGASIPYLRSVNSYWDEDAKGFSSSLTFSKSDFCQRIGSENYTLGETTLTAGGSVAAQVIGDKTFTGRQLRTLFGLRSTRFTLTLEEDQAVFSVLGYGHQVGMSQNGACVLAENGYTYDQILSYYYTDTKVAPLS